jgi:GntR family carbon starvation induced transcriptional regulator
MSLSALATSAASQDNFATQVLSQLKHDILSGYFNPGEKLRMTRLKERYQVGVSPLREALSQLLVEQLVVVENQRGFKVHPTSQEELKDIYQTRASIEALCVEQAITLGDDAWEASILAAAHQLKKAAPLLDNTLLNRQRWEKLHHNFHTAICLGCQSPTLMHVRLGLYEKASRYRNLWLKQKMVESTVFDASMQEHNELVERLLNRDKEQAVALITSHLQAPFRLLKDCQF